MVSRKQEDGIFVHGWENFYVLFSIYVVVFALYCSFSFLPFYRRFLKYIAYMVSNGRLLWMMTREGIACDMFVDTNLSI